MIALRQPKLYETLETINYMRQNIGHSLITFRLGLIFVTSYVYSMLKALEIRNKLLAVDSIREKKHCLPTTIMFFYSLRSLTFEEQQRAVFYILKKGVNRVNIYDLLEIVRPSNSMNADSTNQSYKKNFNEDELKREIALLVAKDNNL